MTNTITTTANGNVVLDWPLRYEMTDALVEAIQQGRQGDNAYYLDVLQHTAPDTEIGPEHELADVLEFFQIHSF